MAKPNIVSLAYFASALIFSGSAYYLSYQAGCVFDGKQGFGNLGLSEEYTGASLSLFVVGAMTFIGGFRRKKWQLHSLQLALVGALSIGLLMFMLIGFFAATQGTQVCKPKDEILVKSIGKLE